MDGQAYLDAVSRGISLVESLSTMPEKIAAAGLSARHAARLRRLIETYFGRVPYPGLQRKSIKHAHATGHDLDSLMAIERQVDRQKGALEKWRLRVALCQTPPDLVAQVAKRHFADAPRPQPQPGIRVTRRAGGVDTLSITSSSLDIADMLGTFHAANPQDLLEGSRQVILRGQAAAVPAVETNVLVGLEEFTQILRGEGDEIELVLTNGARMTGAQYLARALAERGIFTLIHPVAGPLNLYRTQRFASAKQRTMLAAFYPECIWPQCRKPSDFTQYHHVTAWHDGGQTNLDNLAPLCQYHNALNESGRRGRIARVAGQLAWISPRSGRAYPVRQRE